MLSDFYKENPTDRVWWISNIDTFGEHLFSFDKKVIFNLFRDYPHNLTKEQKEIFDNVKIHTGLIFSNGEQKKANSNNLKSGLTTALFYFAFFWFAGVKSKIRF